MAFTDRSDLYGAVHEEGLNRVVRHIMRQRPSLFNYATPFLAQHPDLLFVPIEAAPEVFAASNPLVTVQQPLPVLAALQPVGLNYCVQFTAMEIDFHDSDTIKLPPELGELAPQRLALRLKGCFGLGCLPDDYYSDLILLEEALAVTQGGRDIPSFTHVSERQPRDPIVLPVRKLTCFCLELFAVLHFEWGKIGKDDYLKVRLDGLEIVDLQPVEMENIIECYAEAVLRLGILPRLSVKIEKMVLDVTSVLRERGIAVGQQISLQPAPVPAAVPNNPAIEDDQLKVFVNLVVTP
jgi:hypothetical protein